MEMACLVIQKQNKTVDQVRKIIDTVQKKSAETRPEGCLELFIDLLHIFRAESYDASRIYYLAYLLECGGLKVNVRYRED